MVASQAILRWTTGQTAAHWRFLWKPTEPGNQLVRQDFVEDHGTCCLGSHDHLQTFYSHSWDAFYIRNWRKAGGEVHSDWKGRCNVKSTTSDLRSAYKQLPCTKARCIRQCYLEKPDWWQSCAIHHEHFAIRGLSLGLHSNRGSLSLWAPGDHLNMVWAPIMMITPSYVVKAWSNLHWGLLRSR